MVKLYVEGGGQTPTLKSRLRRAFSKMLEHEEINPRIQIIACGTRNNTYKMFDLELSSGGNAILLVDSEAPVDCACQSGEAQNWKPWDHLKKRDNWKKPPTAKDMDCHLMVEAMEAWFFADPVKLSSYFEAGFKVNKLPKQKPEAISKVDLEKSLKNASKETKKRGYNKGRDSFKILGSLSPDEIRNKCPWGKRFLDHMKSL